MAEPNCRCEFLPIIISGQGKRSVGCSVANVSKESCPRSTIDSSRHFQTSNWINTINFSVNLNHPRCPQTSTIEIQANPRLFTFWNWSSDFYQIHISWFKIWAFVCKNSIYQWPWWRWGGGRQGKYELLSNTDLEMTMMNQGGGSKTNINLNCYQILNRWYVYLFI